MKASRPSTKKAEAPPSAASVSRRKTRWWTYAVGLVCLAAAWPLYRYNVSQLRHQAGLAELEAGDFAAAISALENEEVSSPRSAETVYWLAVAHRRAGHFEAFQKYLERAKKLDYPASEIERQELLLRLQSGEISEDLEQKSKNLIEQAAAYRGPREDLFLDEFYEARAQGHLANYRLFDAELALDHWIQARPESLPARMMRADVLDRGMNFQASEREYREILARAPDNLHSRLQLARLLKMNQKVQAAEKEFRICLQYAPEDFLAQTGLAECEYRSGKGLKAARERLQEVLKRTELSGAQRADVLFLLGEICRSQKDNESAIKYLTDGISISPHPSAQPYRTLSAAYASLNNREEAKRYLELARKTGERDAQMYDIGSKIIQSRDNALLRFQQGNALKEEGENEQAAAWWSMAVRFDPKLQGAHEALAKHYAEKGDQERANYHSRMAEQSAGATFDRLWLDLLDSNVKSVREGLPQLTRYPSQRLPVELLTAGLNVVERKDLDHSLAELNRLAKISTLRLRALTMRAEALYVTGHYKQAERDYLEVLSLSPRNVVAHRGLQAIYFDLGDYGRMEQHALQVAEIDPTDYRPHRHMGFLRREAETWDAAIRDYKESLRRSPHQPSREEVLLEMADCYVHDLKYKEALYTLTDAQPSAQKSFLEAQCKYATKKLPEAKQLLDESLKTSPDHTPSLLLRADIALDEADAAGAREFLERAVKASPFDNNAHLKLSTVLLRLGEKEAAKKEGDRAQELLTLQLRSSELNAQASQRPLDVAIRRELASLSSQLGREEDATRWKRVVDALTEDALAMEKESTTGDQKTGAERLQVPDVLITPRKIGPSTDKELKQPKPVLQVGS